MSSPKGKTRFTIAKKIELIDLVKGKSRKEVCLIYGIAPSSLGTIIKNEPKIREEFKKNLDSNRLLLRKSPYEDLELALIKWFKRKQWNLL